MSRNLYLKEDMDRINDLFLASDSTPIFRYMDFSKYMSILENKKLFFCNTEFFDDQFEGMMPEGFFCNWTEEMKNGYKSITQGIKKYLHAYINCWNKGEEESYALWKIYTNPNTGVAIKSTVGDLKKALNNKDIKIYNVRYIKSFKDSVENYEPPFYFRDTDSILINRRVQEVYKLSTYEYENEIRAVYINNTNVSGMNFDINIHQFIKEIFISPFASKWFYNLVEEITRDAKYSINDNIIFKQSAIQLRG